jgi:dUTP pyrophosphatase
MRFEIVSKYADAGLCLPERKTQASAGYDFQVAEDIVIPSYENIIKKFKRVTGNCEPIVQIDLKDMASVTKDFRLRPTLVPTGIKCEMPEDMYLELYVRSSCPLKHWLVLANGVGIIDADYYNNPDNEGEIFFQMINLSPFDIVLHKGDTIGQGILHKYYTVDNDNAKGKRLGGFGSTSTDLSKPCESLLRGEACMANSLNMDFPYFIYTNPKTKDSATFTTENHDVKYSCS